MAEESTTAAFLLRHAQGGLVAALRDIAADRTHYPVRALLSTLAVACLLGGSVIALLAQSDVETAMTEFVQGQIPGEEMIRPEDLGEAVRFLLHTSRNCHVPEIVFTRPGEGLDTP